MNKFLKIFGILVSIFIILIAIPVALYIFVLPQVVSNPRFLDYIKETVEKEVGAELIVEKPGICTIDNTIKNTIRATKTIPKNCLD